MRKTPITAALTLAAAGLAAAGCKALPFFGGDAAPSVLKADAKPRRGGAMRATIADGMLRTRSERKEQWLVEIEQQLRYATGVLHGHAAAAIDLNALDVEIDAERSGAPDRDGVRDVAYVAAFGVTWPDGERGASGAPASISALLPRGGDAAARDAFFAAFGAACNAAPDAAAPTFWHSYRPQADGCPLRGDEPDRALSVRVRIVLDPLAAAEPEAQPDYAGVWADGKLVVTALFTGAGAEAGVAALAGALRAAHGASGESTADPRDASLTYDVPGKGLLDVRLLAAPSLALPGAARAAWESRLPTTDLAVHAGAASFGAASRTLAAWSAALTPRQRQLGLLVAPARFPYADPAWRLSFGAGGGALDLILAAADPRDEAEAVAASAAAATHALITALGDGRKAYAAVLRDLGPALRARVSADPAAVAQAPPTAGKSP